VSVDKKACRHEIKCHRVGSRFKESQLQRKKMNSNQKFDSIQTRKRVLGEGGLNVKFIFLNCYFFKESIFSAKLNLKWL
jgi:hypothetical protein